jgi:AhpD family alkylhydroperoxidase
MTPVNLTNAPTTSKPILEGVQKKFGMMIPNLMGNFAHNPEALKAYIALGDFFEASGLNTLEQQGVALTVSRENNCGYCMAAHSAMSAMAKLDEKTIQQLRAGETLTDKKLEALRTFTKCMVSAKGITDHSDVQDFLASGYSKEHVLAVIIGITTKTLANYTNHIVETDVDEVFKPFAWSR